MGAKSEASVADGDGGVRFGRGLPCSRRCTVSECVDAAEIWARFPSVQAPARVPVGDFGTVTRTIPLTGSSVLPPT